MPQINDFAKRFRLGLPSATPFKSSGLDGTSLEHCPRCKMEVDTDTQARHEGTTYSYRRSCLRCGTVLSHGVYHNVPILSDIPLPAGTMEWVTKPGIDRR